MSNVNLDNLAITEFFIGHKTMDIADVTSALGITNTQLASIVNDNYEEAVERMVSEAFQRLKSSTSPDSEKIPDKSPLRTPSTHKLEAADSQDSRICRAVSIVREHYKNGTLLRGNRKIIIEEIQRKLNLKNDMTAATYFQDAKKLAELQYTE